MLWPLSCLLTNTWGIQSFGPEPGEVLKAWWWGNAQSEEKPSPCSHYWWFSFKGDKTLQCIYFKNHADAFDQAVSWYRPFYWVCGSNSSKVQGFPEISLPLWADVTAKSLYFYKDKVLLQFPHNRGNWFWVRSSHSLGWVCFRRASCWSAGVDYTHIQVLIQSHQELDCELSWTVHGSNCAWLACSLFQRKIISN